MNHYDYIIIGFGKGGKTLAVDLSEKGKNVAMIEQSNEMYGGTCINIACIPTKVLVNHANQRKEDSQSFYSNAVDDKNNVTRVLREKSYQSLQVQENITIYTARAEFKSEREIRLKSEMETLDLTGNHFIINTGSIPHIPPIEGIENVKNIYTSTELQNVTHLPEHLIIAGGGNVGLEFASMYANFGSKVTVIDSSEEILKSYDYDVVQEVKKVLEEKNISFIHDSKVVHVENHDSGIEIQYEKDKHKKEKLVGSALLLATGRKPNTDNLKLEEAGVKTDDKGAILVNDYLKTSNEHIWAIGDVNGGDQFTYISLDDYRIVRDQLTGLGNYNLKERSNVPTSIFIDPVFSHVGITEKEAKMADLEHEVTTMPADNIPRTKINKQSNGILKVIVNPGSKQILGATLFCADSSEIINIIRLAMEAKVPYTMLRDTIFTHPTMAEALNDLLKQLD